MKETKRDLIPESYIDGFDTIRDAVDFARKNSGIDAASLNADDLETVATKHDRAEMTFKAGERLAAVCGYKLHAILGAWGHRYALEEVHNV